MRSTALGWALCVLGCFDPAAMVGGDTTGEPDETTSSASSASSSTSSSSDESSSTTSDDSSTSAATTTGDSSSESSTTTSTLVPCDEDEPFSPPVVIPGLDTDNNEDRAWLSDDELTIYVSSNREGDYQIYSAGRDAIDDDFGELALLAGDGDEQRGPAMTADGLALFVGAGPSGGDYDLMVAVRGNPLAEFGAFEPVNGVNSTAIDRAPWIDDDASTLYFESYRDGTLDIFRTTREAGGAFEIPEPVVELVTESEDGAPVLQAGGLVLWFASNREGGVGDYDVWVATRSTEADGFGEPINVPEVGSDAIDWPTWVSSDGCRLYLASRRDGGDFDLMLAERG